MGKKYITATYTLFFLVIIFFISCDEYKEPEYIVTFDANGATGTPPPPMKAVNESSIGYYYTIKLPDKGSLSYAGKLFYGWNTKADGTGKQYFPYTSGYSYTPDITKNTTMYAQWINEFAVAPNNLRLSLISYQTARLTWDAVEGYNLREISYFNDGDMVITYVVFRRATSAGKDSTSNFIPWAFTSEPIFSDRSLGGEGGDRINGSIYEYFVTLGVVTVTDKYDINIGQHSNVVTTPRVFANYTGIPAPDNVSAVANSATRITVSWRQRTQSLDYEAGIIGYYVYTSFDGTNFEREPNIVPYIHDSLTWPIYNTYTKTALPSTKYYFRIAGAYTSGRGNLSSTVSVTTPALPLQVTGVKAAAHSSTCIVVSWDIADGATAYRVYYEIGNSTTKYVADTVIGKTYTHTGLTANTDYRYTIKPIIIDAESSQFSNSAYCRTPASSSAIEPVILTLTNNTSYTLKTIKINNGNNMLSSNLYKNTSCQIQLNPGTYTISVYDTGDSYMSFSVTIGNNSLRHSIVDNWPSYTITLRNNYTFAVAKAYVRKRFTENWGINRINNAIVTNASRLLGTFEQDAYEVMAESQEYYRVSTATNDIGITVTGGVLDGYRPVWYVVPPFTLNSDITVTAPATGWGRIFPE